MKDDKLKTDWSCVVDNEVWICQSLLEDEVVDQFSCFLQNFSGFNMNPTEEIRKSFRKAKVNPTLYNYTVHPLDSVVKRKMAKQFFDKVNDLLFSLNEKKVDEDNLKILNFFAKSFCPDSFYDLHTEPEKMFGRFAFVFFLEDCEGANLVFPDDKMLNERIKDSLQKKSYEESIKALEEHGERARIIGPLVIRPKRNTCVIFKVGSFHWVDHPKDKFSPIQRRSITGWPYATTKLIDSLNSYCKLNKYF